MGRILREQGIPTSQFKIPEIEAGGHRTSHKGILAGRLDHSAEPNSFRDKGLQLFPPGDIPAKEQPFVHAVAGNDVDREGIPGIEMPDFIGGKPVEG
jgi:hypothetical protein